MSKKKAVGADYLLMDIPMGEGTKVKTMDEAKAYARDFIELGEKLDIRVECAITYGGQPVGRAIGPALEASEAISMLEGRQGTRTASSRRRSASGGMLFDMGGEYQGDGEGQADPGDRQRRSRSSRRSWRPRAATRTSSPPTSRSGSTAWTSSPSRADTSDRSRTRTWSGWPARPVRRGTRAPGWCSARRCGNKVDKGETIFTIYAENEWKLQEALKLAIRLEPVQIQGMVLARVPSFSRVDPLKPLSPSVFLSPRPG